MKHSYNKCQNILNEGCEDQMRIYGFKRSRCREIACNMFYLLTLGILKLVFDWYPFLMVRLRCTKSNLEDADYVQLVDRYKQLFVAKVFSSINTTEKYFFNKKVKYVWNGTIFEKLRGPHYGKACSFFHQCQGFTEPEQETRRFVYGSNSVKIHVTPILKLLYTQGLNPFYVFQAFSCTLWFLDQYYYFAGCIILLSAVSLTAQIHQMRHSERKLKHAIGNSENVSVFRRDTGKYELVDGESLVPGDVVEIPRGGCLMQCDAVLTSGVCIVNESMLTGESIPITKTSIVDDNDEMFREKDHSRHVIYCGTKVIQTRFYDDQKVTAVVMHTGFMTSKGELIRSILFPKPVNFKFTQDSYKFLACLSLVAAIGMFYTIVLMVNRKETLKRIVVRTLDLVTIVIPPALPAAMTVGVVMAQKRLWDWMIYCINSNNINLCGAVDCFCFDKTGTLTEDGLDFKGVVPIVDGSFKPEVKDVRRLGSKDKVVVTMATCHSLTTIDNEIVGDPVDLKMFEATDWVFDGNVKFDTIAPTVVKPRNNRSTRIHDEIDETEEDDYGILRQFTFSSKLQRMSVVARRLDSAHYDLFCKGAPEMVASLSNPESIPENFHEVLMSYTRKGHRVLALAHRDLKMGLVKVQRCPREQVERKLRMIGLIVFENQLKAETKPVIDVLLNANVRPVMVTGDNLLTALSVAKNCDMIGPKDKIVFLTSFSSVQSEEGKAKFELHWTKVDDEETSDDINLKPSDQSRVSFKDDLIEMTHCAEPQKVHLAVTGKSWSLIRRHHPSIINELLEHGTVFARFSPDQKQQLIECLIEARHFVGMCGDGANDCGALKAAHAGISLSEAEASVASPFTSKQANISCVPNLIREGRAALVTSFGIFKFMAGYSLTQFTSVCLLYWIGANLTDLQFLYIDLILLSALSFTFSRTHAYPDLAPSPPRVSLLAISPILSILTQVFMNLSFQLIVWFYVSSQPWFETYVAPPLHIRNFACHEVTSIFSISSFQYIIMAVVFSKGAPYRKTVFSNYFFLLTIMVTTALNILITMSPITVQWFFTIFQLKPAPDMVFKLILVSMASLNFVVSFTFELFLIDLGIDRFCSKRGASTNAVQNLTNSTIPRDVTTAKNPRRPCPSSLENGDNYLSLSGKNRDMSQQNQIAQIKSSWNSLFHWLPQQNEYQNLAELLEMEQTTWDEMEASAHSSTEGFALDLSGGEEEGVGSNSPRVSLIRGTEDDAIVTETKL